MPQHSAVNPTAVDGYTRSADSYVRGRPGYPPQALQWLRATLGLGPGMTVADLGAGTGKFTPLLVETGATVIAVEPIDQMLAKLSAALPQVQTLSGSAESIPLPDASVDAVVCAQAFHWFANARALAEIHRVLKPGGRLGLIWNMRDGSTDWVARLNRIVDQYEGGAPRYYNGAWRQAFPFAGFGPLHDEHFRVEHRGSPEDVIFNRVRSTSFIAKLPEAERAHIDAQLQALIDGEPTLKGRDEVAMPYVTDAFCAVKQG